MRPTIISFYTKTWQYVKHSERLKAECDRLGLNHYIVELPDTGDWTANTRMKSKFIKETMDKLDTPLLWIDVDGSILKSPTAVFDSEFDFMGRHQRTGPRRNWHVGTMFFNNTETVKELLYKWNEFCDLGHGTDEASFDEAWKAMNGLITYKELSEEYFVILGDHEIPAHHVVIAHRLSKCESKLETKRRAAMRKV